MKKENTTLYIPGESRYTEIETHNNTITTQAATIQCVFLTKRIDYSLPALASSSRALLFSSAPNPWLPIFFLRSLRAKSTYVPRDAQTKFATKGSRNRCRSVFPKLIRSLILRSLQTSSHEPQIQAGDCSSSLKLCLLMFLGGALQ
jgi:hypothetical protein